MPLADHLAQPVCLAQPGGGAEDMADRDRLWPPDPGISRRIGVQGLRQFDPKADVQTEGEGTRMISRTSKDTRTADGVNDVYESSGNGYVAASPRFFRRAGATLRGFGLADVVVCILEDILSIKEDDQIAHGHSGKVIDGRVAFQEGAEDEFTVAIERLTERRVTAFLSANQTAPGVACELFFLELPPA